MLWLFIPLAFLLGSIPFGLLLGKVKGIDIREHGSGNIGSTNVFRTLGKKVRDHLSYSRHPERLLSRFSGSSLCSG